MRSSSRSLRADSSAALPSRRSRTLWNRRSERTPANLCRPRPVPLLAMPGIVYDPIDAYIHDLAPRADDALREVERQGREERWPIVGPAEGSLLHILARAVRATRILELGTAIGYSGTWLARALPAGGELITAEWDPDTAAIATRNFTKTGVANRVRIEVGSAVDILPRLKGPFDFIFNDIDKQFYVEGRS